MKIFTGLTCAIVIVIALCGCQTTKLVPEYIMPTASTILTAPLPDLQTIKKPGTTSDASK